MNKEDVWRLFETTGKIEYYLKYRKMVEGKIEPLGSNRDKGNYN